MICILGSVFLLGSFGALRLSAEQNETARSQRGRGLCRCDDKRDFRKTGSPLALGQTPSYRWDFSLSRLDVIDRGNFVLRLTVLISYRGRDNEEERF